MKRLACLSMLVGVCVSAAQAKDRCRYGRDRNMDCGESFAMFEFAPASGAGMGTACACSAVTGAKGETMTFARASDASCMKGGTVTGIANGDLVTCTSGQPRVMYGGDGTGVLGLDLWMARTNSTIRSAELDNAAWSDFTNTTSPTVTADQAVAPDGNTAAERIQFPATGIGQFSGRRVTSGCPATSHGSASIFVKGVSGSGTIEIGSTDGVTVYFMASVAFNSSTWTRISKSDFATGVSTQPFYIGNFGWDASAPGAFGTVARSAADVYMWGAQCEIGETVSPYIATAGTAATRVLETAQFATPMSGYTTGSLFASVTWSTSKSSESGNPMFVALDQAVTNAQEYVFGTTATGAVTFGGSSGTVALASQSMAAGVHRTGGYWTGTGSSATVVWDANTNTGSITAGTASITRLLIGGYNNSSSNAVNGTIKLVCADNSSTRCR